MAGIQHGSGDFPSMDNVKDKHVMGDRWTRYHQSPDRYGEGGDGHWINEALGGEHKKGELHKALHVPAGEAIPVGKLKAKAGKGGRLAKRAQAVLNANPEKDK
jgi:hypothetical protein